MGGGALASAGIGFWDEGGASGVRQGGVMRAFSGVIPVEQGEGVGWGGVASRGCPRRADASYAREARTI